MSHVLTETATSANFAVGKTVPDTGDGGTIWWGLIIATIQDSSNREQWLKAWHADAPYYRVPLNAAKNTSSRFAATSYTNGGLYWSQSDVTDAGGLFFPVGTLPVGRKITQVLMYWANPTNSNAATALGTAPTVSLVRTPLATGTIVGFTDPSVVVATGTDATAVAADYQKAHTVASSTFSETISDLQEYVVVVTGETGANSATGGHVHGVRLVLGY